MSIPPLGIIEGYFGTPWTWEERTHVMRTLAEWDYVRFTYAPKADAKLRRRWTESYTDAEAAEIERFAAACRDAGVKFGVGLSPFELYLDPSPEMRRTLRRRAGELKALGAEHIALLFDDMRGDMPDLAAIQADLAGEAAAETGGPLTICPTYYSDDPVLDRVFGERPERYLADLGERLAPEIGIYWTGPEVCSLEITRGHLDRVASLLRRRPTLWDNYPVNDGPRMSRRLHLRGFTGRRDLSGCVEAHDINPALQPHLTLLPAATLAIAYRDGPAYDYAAAQQEAAHDLYPDELAAHLVETTLALQDGGIDHIAPERVKVRYEGIDHPAAEEVVRFAEGGYVQTADEVKT